MRLILVSAVFALAPALASAQSYQPFLRDDVIWEVVWSFVSAGQLEGQTHYYAWVDSSLDSVHNDTLYRKIVGSAGNESVYLTEDSILRQVLVKNPGEPVQQVLYDFTLGVGDSVEANYTYPTFNGTDSMMRVFLTYTDSTTDVPRHAIEFEINDSASTTWCGERWIEGIGSTQGPFRPDPSDCWHAGLQLSCYRLKKNLVPIYGYECSSLGVEEGQLKPNIHVLPNPASDVLTVSSPSALKQVELINALGQRISIAMGTNQRDLNVDVSHMASGIYLVRIETSEGAATRKIVVH